MSDRPELGGSRAITPEVLLRPGLLDSVNLLLAGAPRLSQVGLDIGRGAERLGARVARFDPLEGETIEDALAGAIARSGAPDMVALDASSLPETAPDGAAATEELLQLTWEITRSVAQRAFIEPGRAGRIALIGPAGGGGEQAVWRGGARAALENLARTLSIEWSRYGITTVCVLPGRGSAPGELAAIVAYLASPAGAYFSGCVLELTQPLPGEQPT